MKVTVSFSDSWRQSRNALNKFNNIPKIPYDYLLCTFPTSYPPTARKIISYRYRFPSREMAKLLSRGIFGKKIAHVDRDEEKIA